MKRFPFLVLCLAVFAGQARADYVEVRRAAIIKQAPESDADIVLQPAIGDLLVLRDNHQTDGYYNVIIAPAGNSAVTQGWIYRTLVRRFPGLPPEGETPAPNTEVLPGDAGVIEATTISWPASDETSPEPHTVFGIPRYAQHSPNHNLIRDYTGFTVYWDDVVLGPRWASIKLTRFMADRNDDMDRSGSFKRDDAIVDAGLQATVHNDYNNPPGSKAWSRGHIVQFDDARGWGDESGEESFLTTNIVPQLQAHNGKRWLALEQLCTEFARDYGTVWVYCGPIYATNPQPFAPNRKVPAPIAFYKIAVARGENDAVDVVAFRMPHEDIASSVPLSDFIVSVDAIEQATGIDFLHELPDAVENPIEATVWQIWPNL